MSTGGKGLVFGQNSLCHVGACCRLNAGQLVCNPTLVLAFGASVHISIVFLSMPKVFSATHPMLLGMKLFGLFH